MKRKLIGLLCAFFLLSGCRDGSDPTLLTEPSVTETAVTETPAKQPDVSRLPLLEQGTVLEESSNLLHIPNEALDGMELPQMRLLGNGLLLSEYQDQNMILNHISLEDGALIASSSIPAREGTGLYIGSGEIALCDRESGLISILDESFRVLRTYPVTAGGDDWYLNQELDTLYIIDFDRGLKALNLETGAEIWLVDNGFEVQSIGGSGSYMFIRYTDRTDKKTYTRCVNLSTATVETLPITGAVSGVVRHGELWLLQRKDDHVLVDGETARCFAWDGADARLLSPRRHLLTMDYSRRELTLRDTGGAFLSRCSLPQNSNAITGSDFVWSGYWSGYFFTDFIDGSSRLLFWDVAADTDGEDIQMMPLDAVEKTEYVMEQQLYDRAQELSNRFGVDIRIADQCSMDYTTFDACILDDPMFIREDLNLLEKALSRYPDGFFSQLCFDSIETVRFELVGTLTRKEGVTDRQDTVGGFAQNMDSYYLIALNGFTMSERTIYHETSHIIDKMLAWDALLREDALYSEEVWLALQPKGFKYSESYMDVTVGKYDADYFVSDYSMTYPTEDRAELMAEAMFGIRWPFEVDTGCRAKMQFYSDCIRDCFNTEGWPEVTVWEQVLK